MLEEKKEKTSQQTEFTKNCLLLRYENFAKSHIQ